MKRILRVCLVAGLTLLLRADSCSTTDRQVETPLQFTLELDVAVVQNTDVETTVAVATDLAAPLLAALENRESDAIPDSVFWVGMSAVFTRNDGFDTTRDLSIAVGDPGAEIAFVSSPVPIPSNATGETALVGIAGGVPFPDRFQLLIDSNGLAVLDLHRIANEALEEFRTTADVAPRDLSLVADWDNDRSPGDAADDFTLRVRLNFQMVDARDSEVYAP